MNFITPHYMKNDNCFTNNFLALAKCDSPSLLKHLLMIFEDGAYRSVGKALI